MTIAFLSLFLQPAFAQTAWVIELRDKAQSPYSLERPHEFLSQRAIDRRKTHKIPLHQTDLPLSPQYLNQMRQLGAQIKNVSKWFNTVTVEGVTPETLQAISQLSFVKKTLEVNRRTKSWPVPAIFRQNGREDVYGMGFRQIQIHRGDELHAKGFMGKGLMIAVIDAGFYAYQTLPAFDSVNLRAQIADTYDFVLNKKVVNDGHEHGMQVFSILAANIPGRFVGTAPDAAYLLYRSEHAAQESPLETYNWIAALERADSAGADVVNTSLGYNTFDNPKYNYTHAMLDGKTTPMARAATIAARKGMLLVVAAGNEGDRSWKTITTPADADSILSVAAVDTLGRVAPFSSRGPTADHRIAPSVASLGAGAMISSVTGEIISGNGTSLAAPNICGLAACLWQAFPECSNMEIIAAIQQSASQYTSPDHSIGYGIPDFLIAYELLEQKRLAHRLSTSDKELVIYPNPARGTITVCVRPTEKTGRFMLYNTNGQLIWEKHMRMQNDIAQTIRLENLPLEHPGVYLIRFTCGRNTQMARILVSP